ncbi:YciI family protein [Mycobacterium sp.]|uniref:YciI family protein n=1 Tax=Mycobacterium sp. TaxID=1785 RepID=UPI003C74F90A
MRSVTEHSALGDGHEVVYLVYSELAGDDPRAILGPLADHLTFLSQLAREGLLVTGGPLETPHGANSGNGIYVLRAASLPAAEAVAARDPLHAQGIRVARVHRWNRKKDWSARPDRESLPS